MCVCANVNCDKRARELKTRGKRNEIHMPFVVSTEKCDNILKRCLHKDRKQCKISVLFWKCDRERALVPLPLHAHTHTFTYTETQEYVIVINLFVSKTEANKLNKTF